MRLNVMLPALLLSSVCGIAVAQQSVSQTPIPVTPPSSSMSYESAFADYRPMQDIKMAPVLEDWRAANDTVGQIGGHAGVLKGGSSTAAQPMQHAKPAQASPQNAPVTPSKPSPHQGH